MKKIKYINKDLHKKDLETITEIIGENLTDKGIDYSAFSYEIHIHYQVDDGD